MLNLNDQAKIFLKDKLVVLWKARINKRVRITYSKICAPLRRIVSQMPQGVAKWGILEK